MVAAWLTAFGAVLVPAAMVWALEAPRDLHPFVIWGVSLIVGVIGLILVLFGLARSVADDVENRKRRKEEEKRWEESDKLRQNAERRRQDEHVEYLTTLKAIAKAIGVRSVVLEHRIQRGKDEVRKHKEDGDSDEWWNSL